MSSKIGTYWKDRVVGMAVGFALVLSAATAFADVRITPATGGSGISADTAANGASPAWTTLGPIVIDEPNGAHGRDDFHSGANITLILKAPAGFQFNTAVTPNITASGGGITAAAITISDSTTITITLTVVAGRNNDTLTIGNTTGIQVRPTAGSPLRSGQIYRPATGGGTAVIDVITTSANADGSGGSNFGTLTEVLGAPSKLAFGVEPSSTSAGLVISPAVTAHIQDQFGNPIASAATVVLSIGNDPGGGTLSGTRTIAAVNGTATFNDLSINEAGIGYTLVAASGNLTSATSSAFNITAGPPTKLGITTAPQRLTVGVSSGLITVELQDASGNPVITATNLTITLTGSSASGVFRDVTDTANITSILIPAGTSSISYLYLDTSVGTPTITNTADSFTAVTQTERVTEAPALVRVETAADGSGTIVASQNIVAGSSLTVFAVSRDAASNFVDNVAADVWSLPLKTGGVVDGDLVPSGDRKSAVFTGHLTGTATVRATLGALPPTDSGTLNVVEGVASKLAIITAPQTLTAGVSSALITVQIQDAGGNPVNPTSARVITLTSSSAGGTFRDVTDTTTITTLTIPIGLNSTSFLYRATRTGSATITNTTPGLTTATQTETVIAAPAALVRVETKADGTGTLVPAQSFIANNSLTVFAIARDAFSNYVANVTAVWTLPTKTGGVANTDLVAVGDGKSAVFIGNLGGTATIRATSGALTPTDSGTITVNPCYPTVDVMLVIDRSGSMAGEPFNDARLACSNFVQNLRFPSNSTSFDQGGLVSFASEATLDQPLTNSHPALNQAIAAIPALSSGTAISLGVQAAQTELLSSRHNPQALPVMVLLSDGLPSGGGRGTTDALDAATQAKNAGTRLFTVGLGSANGTLLSRMASSTNDYFVTENSSQLSALFDAIATILCRPRTNIFGPTDLTVCPGATATFSVTATGCDPITYQWSKDDSPIAGATNSTLILNGITAANTGAYSVLINGACVSSRRSATLTVSPLPVIHCAGNETVELGAAWTFATPTATDGTITVFSTVTNLACGNTFNATRTWRATNACGNLSQCAQTVTVVDTTAPTILCATNRTVEAGTAWTFDPPTAGDLANGTNVTLTVVNTQTNSVCGNTFIATQTWQAADACGNLAECSQTVTVIDKTRPVITCSSNLVFTADVGRCSRSNVTFTVSATDNCRVTNLVSSPPNGSTFPFGTTTVTNTATDASGNTASCTFTVTVTDNQNPSITCPSNRVLTADPGRSSRSNVVFSVSASDNCRVTNMVSSPPSGSTFPVGTTTVTTTATDGRGNTSSCSFTVTVTGPSFPVITCPTNLVLLADAGRCSRSNVTFTVTATADSGVTNLVSTPPSGSTFPIGTTTVTNTATDASGNQSSCTFTIRVIDTQSPQITCPSDITVAANSGCTATNVSLGTPVTSDNCAVASVTNNAGIIEALPGGEPETSITNSGGVTTVTWASQPGRTYRLLYKDSLTATNWNMVTGDVTAVSATTSQTDFVGGLAQRFYRVELLGSGAVGSFGMGTNLVIWTVTDTSGNQSSCSFTVRVTDNQNPVLTCSSNLVLTADAGRCDRSNVTFTVSATDNCSVTNLVSSPPSGSTFPVGVTTVTNIATDDSGNQSSCTFTVTVLDQELPALTCPPDLTTNVVSGANGVTNIALGAPVIADNCMVASVSNNAPAILPAGTNFVLWTVTDGSGNSRSCQQRVVVVQGCSGLLTATPFSSQSVCSNQAVQFATTASSPEPITYLWKFNGQPIDGQTNNSLVLPNVGPSAGGVYAVEVRTACAAVTNSATLTVRAAVSENPAAYTNSTGIVINEFGPASPYGSVITPQCIPGSLKGVTVGIFGFTHVFPSDVIMVLVSPDGRQVKLMAGAGGSVAVSGGVDLVFSDSAPNLLPESDQIVSGTYQPTDYLPGIILPPPAGGPYSNNLAAFIGADADGPWRLAVLDNGPLDGGGIASWSLTLEWQQNTQFLLRNPTRLANGNFRIEVFGQRGIPTIIQRSSNLTTWLPVATNVFSTSPGIFIDSAPVYSERYYRAVQP